MIPWRQRFADKKSVIGDGSPPYKSRPVPESVTVWRASALPEPESVTVWRASALPEPETVTVWRASALRSRRR